MDPVPTEPWSHNLHYHRVVLGAIVWPPPMTYRRAPLAGPETDRTRG
jgi:hypothetical protein